MGENRFYKYNCIIHSIPANTKRQLANINIHVQTYSGITLIGTINEKKTVTKYFNRSQLNKNVVKRNENMWKTNLQDTHLD